jgi:hypothetical protein
LTLVAVEDGQDLLERARLVAVRCLYDVADTRHEDQRTFSELAQAIVDGSAPRRRLRPLLSAALLLQLTVASLQAGGNAVDSVESDLEGEIYAAPVKRSELRVRIAQLADEIEPLAHRLAERAASDPAIYMGRQLPGFAHRLREAAGEVAACAALLTALSR